MTFDPAALYVTEVADALDTIIMSGGCAAGASNTHEFLEALQTFVQAEARPAEVVMPKQDAISAKAVADIAELRDRVSELELSVEGLGDTNSKQEDELAKLHDALLDLDKDHQKLREQFSQFLDIARRNNRGPTKSGGLSTTRTVELIEKLARSVVDGRGV